MGAWSPRRPVPALHLGHPPQSHLVMASWACFGTVSPMWTGQLTTERGSAYAVRSPCPRRRLAPVRFGDGRCMERGRRRGGAAGIDEGRLCNWHARDFDARPERRADVRRLPIAVASACGGQRPVSRRAETVCALGCVVGKTVPCYDKSVARARRAMGLPRGPLRSGARRTSSLEILVLRVAIVALLALHRKTL